MKPESNLDYLAARHAQDLVAKEAAKEAKPQDLENTVTKALGVLQEDGVYACFLYLHANKKKEARPILEEMQHLLNEDELGIPKKEGDDVLKYTAEKITTDLPTLLLAKEALERMLIYARYGAKAAQKQPNDEAKSLSNQEGV